MASRYIMVEFIIFFTSFSHIPFQNVGFEVWKKTFFTRSRALCVLKKALAHMRIHQDFKLFDQHTIYEAD